MDSKAYPAAAGSMLTGIVQQRCPRCRRAPLFTHSALNLAHFTEMPAKCPVCSQAYEPEPGFYWGAMYISFSFSTAMMLIVGVLVYYLLGDPDTWVYVTAVAIVAVLMTPFNLRYSRTLMLYLFGGVEYNPRYSEGAQAR